MAEYTERLYPDYDIETAVSEGSSEKVQAYIDDRIRCFQKLALERDTAKLKKELTSEYRLCDWLIQKYTTEKNVDYFFGYFVGLLTSFKNQLNVEFKGKHVDLIGEANVPHLDDILFTIEEHEGIRHGKLAEAIGIEKSTLTGIMDRIVASGAVVFSRPGKYKFYFLTEAGRNYCNNNRKRYTSRKTIDTLVEDLIELIERESNPAETVGKVVQTIYERKSNSSLSPYMDSQTSKTEELMKLLSEEKPRFSIWGDQSGNSYRLESVLAIHDVSRQEYELIFRTNTMPKKTNAPILSRREAI